MNAEVIGLPLPLCDGRMCFAGFFSLVKYAASEFLVLWTLGLVSLASPFSPLKGVVSALRALSKVNGALARP